MKLRLLPAFVVGAVATSIVLVAVSAGPAAADPPTVSNPTTDLAGPPGPTRASFTVSATVRMDPNSGLDQGAATATAKLHRGSASGRVVSTNAAPNRNVDGDDTWEVRIPLSVGQTDPNGRYTVVVDATAEDSAGCPLGLVALGCEVTSPASNSASVALAVLPQKPDVPKLNVDATARTVALEWAANPEPDIVEYVVLRKPPGGEFQPIALVGQPKAQDGKPAPKTVRHVDRELPSPAGDYAYLLRVARAGASGVVSHDAKDLLAMEDTTRVAIAKGIPADAAAASPNAAPPVNAVNLPGGALGPGRVPSIPQVGGNVPDVPSVSPGPTLAGDDSFDAVLPYETEAGGAQDPARLELPIDGEQTGTSRPIVFYVAAALLAIAVAMHLLWLRREVGKVPPDGLVPLGPADIDSDGHSGSAAAALVHPSVEAPAGSMRADQPSRVAGWLASVRGALPRRRAREAEAWGEDRLAQLDRTEATGDDRPTVRDDAVGEAPGDADPVPPDDEPFAPPTGERRLVVSIGGSRDR